MKTVMKLLFEKFDRYPIEHFSTYLKVNRKLILKKEKEQLEEARLKGYGEGYNEGIYDAENK